MTHLTQLVQQLAKALIERGIPCYTEYPNTPLAFHGDGLFAVAAPEALRLHTPIYTADATILPATLSLGTGFFLPPAGDCTKLHTLITSALLPAVFAVGWQLTEIRTEEICYDKQIDRLCLQAHLTVHAVLTLSTAEEVAADGQ